jgi:hypothetical protein
MGIKRERNPASRIAMQKSEKLRFSYAFLRINRREFYGN